MSYKLPDLPPNFFWHLKVYYDVVPWLVVKIKQRRSFLGIKFSTTAEDLTVDIEDEYLQDTEKFQELAAGCISRTLGRFMGRRALPVQLGAAQGVLDEMMRNATGEAKKVYAVHDDQGVMALFDTEELADQWLSKYLTSTEAEWADAEMPGWSENLGVVAMTVFESSDVPEGFVPEVYS
jgi:hypothetical protein